MWTAKGLQQQKSQVDRKYIFILEQHKSQYKTLKFTLKMTI